MVNSRDNLIEGLPAENLNQNDILQTFIKTEMNGVNVATTEPTTAEEILKKESTINDILQKSGKSVSSTGFSAILFVNNATEVNIWVFLYFQCYWIIPINDAAIKLGDLITRLQSRDCKPLGFLIGKALQQNTLLYQRINSTRSLTRKNCIVPISRCDSNSHFNDFTVRACPDDASILKTRQDIAYN